VPDWIERRTFFRPSIRRPSVGLISFPVKHSHGLILNACNRLFSTEDKNSEVTAFQDCSILNSFANWYSHRFSFF
jgi:hypothetical protein